MLRLSELLERLRPAGTPGAPTEGEHQRRQAQREHEIAGVTAVLRSFEADAREVIAAGHAEAERVRQDGERRADLIRTQLPDRIAIARAEAVRGHDDRGGDEIARLRRDADREVARIDADAAARIPEIVDEVVAAVWSTVTAPPDDRSLLPNREDQP